MQVRFVIVGFVPLLFLWVGCAGRLGSKPIVGHIPKVDTLISSTGRSTAEAIGDSLALVEHVEAETASRQYEEMLFRETNDASEVDNPTKGEITNPGSRAGLSKANGRPWRSPKSSGLAGWPGILGFLGFEGVWGYRNDLKGSIRLGRRFLASLRTGETRPVAFATAGDLGPLETIAVGNLRARFGEGLILGNRDSDTPPRCFGRGVGRFRVGGSLSRWERTDAVAAGIRPGRFQIAALLWKRPVDRSGTLREEGWCSVSFVNGNGWAGIAVGIPSSGERSDAPLGAPPNALSISFGLRQAANGAPSRGGARRGLSGEVSLMGSTLFFAIGASAKGGSDWWFRIFRQPAAGGYGVSVNGLARVAKILQGGTFQWRRRFGRTKAGLLVYAAAARNPSRVSRYRRCTLYLSGIRSRPHRWKGSVSVIESRKTDVGSGILGSEILESRWSESRIRAGWEYRPSRPWSQHLRLDTRFDDRGRLYGILLSASTRITYRWFEATWRVTNYTLAPGSSGFVSRPGVGPFEYLSAVYRDGSDVCFRVRIMPSTRLDFFWYYGVPWEKERRLYFGMRWKG